ncbi:MULTISPECIES: hypothetical protein [Bacillus]|uniref:hypothetical protein n=1 Tax=Bacillus TaxID=1386 RepID=UPI0002E466A8|nr:MULTISPECIES: hypothetical protein [Bacillus]
MTRIINVETIRKLVTDAEMKKLNESIVLPEKNTLARALVNGKEAKGTVVFRKKANYGIPFENKA